ncbi:hypothetical protein RFI_14240, partial [Reticulomyxa filosa]
MDRVQFSDPAVLMLDGMSLESLDSFLESASDSLVDTLKGEEDATLPTTAQIRLSQNVDEKKKSAEDGQGSKAVERTTILELSKLLKEFKAADNPANRAKFRDEFFFCYSNLDVVHRLAIPPQ